MSYTYLFRDWGLLGSGCSGSGGNIVVYGGRADGSTCIF